MIAAEVLYALAPSIASGLNDELTLALNSAAQARQAVAAESPVAAHLDTAMAAVDRCADLAERLMQFGSPHRRKQRCEVADLIYSAHQLLDTIKPTGVVLSSESSNGVWVDVNEADIQTMLVTLALDGFAAMQKVGGAMRVTGLRDASVVWLTLCANCGGSNESARLAAVRTMAERVGCAVSAEVSALGFYTITLELPVAA